MTPQEPVTRDPTPDEIAVYEQQMTLAQTAAGIMRNRKLGPRRETTAQSRQRRNKILARKVKAAGVRSAADLSRR